MAQEDLDLQEFNLQPLRVISGWNVEWNTFYEVDPHKSTLHYFEGSSLLHLNNYNAKRAINLEWRPEADLNGCFLLRVINLIDNFNPKNNTLEYDGDWEHEHYSFTSKNRLEIVVVLERLMLQLGPFKDVRILKNRGEVDEPSESFRIELFENGISTELVSKIIEFGNSQIQSLLIDFSEIDKQTLQILAEKGFNKGVVNKAKQKLNSKKFR